MKRKHWFASFILTWFFLQASAQSNAIFNEFKNAEHAKYTVISPYLTTLGKIFMGKSPDEKLAKKVKSIKILNLENSSYTIQNLIQTRINDLPKKKYSTMVEYEDVHMMVKPHKAPYKEILIYLNSNNSCTLIQITGKFKKEDLFYMVKEQMEWQKKQK